MAVNNQVLQKMVDQANQKSPKSGSGGKLVAVLLTAIVIGAGVWAYDNLVVIKAKDQALMEATNKANELDNQNKNLAQQLNDLNQAKEEEQKLKTRTVELANYNVSVVLPEGDTFLADDNWSNVPGLYNFKIQDANFSQNNVPYLLAYTLEAIKQQEDSCKLSGCPEYLDTVKQFTEERDLWKNDKNSIASDSKVIYEIKTFNDTKYAAVNRRVVGDSGYSRTYFTFLDDNTKLVIKIFIPDETATQAADAFMSNFNLVIN